MHNCWRLRFARDLPQKSAFALIRLDEMYASPGLISIIDGSHEAGKPCARPKVKPKPCFRHRTGNLERIGKMPDPKIVEGRVADEVDRALPFLQNVCVDFEPPQCILRQRGQKRVVWPRR